jgi:hypothetical protein
MYYFNTVEGHWARGTPHETYHRIDQVSSMSRNSGDPPGSATVKGGVTERSRTRDFRGQDLSGGLGTDRLNTEDRNGWPEGAGFRSKIFSITEV